MELKGTSIIGFDRGARGGDTFTAFNPETGEAVQPDFHSASQEELDRAAGLADAARNDAEAQLSAISSVAFITFGGVPASEDVFTSPKSSRPRSAS